MWASVLCAAPGCKHLQVLFVNFTDTFADSGGVLGMLGKEQDCRCIVPVWNAIVLRAYGFWGAAQGSGSGVEGDIGGIRS